MSKNFSCDTLALRLMEIGKDAAALPPAWDGAKITYLVAGPQGEFIGKMLPGKGLLLFDDLKHYGINKLLPNVFERTLAFRLRDLLRSERGAITSLADLLAARATQKHGARANVFSKATTGTINRWANSYARSGTPDAGTFTAIPGGAAFSQLTAGALNYGFAQPTAPDKAFLMSFGIGQPDLAMNKAILIDMLVGANNIDTTVATAQTVNTTALTRNTTGAGVMCFLEVTNTLGTNVVTLTLNKYTNQAGTANQSSVANNMIQSAGAQQLPYDTVTPFFALASGDYGVRSVEEVTFSGAMTGTGKLAIVLCMPIMWIPGMPGAFAGKRDDTTNINGATQLAQTSGGLTGCLSLLVGFSGSAAMQVVGDIEVAFG